MPANIKTINDLQLYMNGVLERASHHANGVKIVFYALVGFVMHKAESDSIIVRTESGDMKNVVKARINDKPYFFGFVHDDSPGGGFIEIRENNSRGDVLVSKIDNDTSLQDLENIFSNL